MSDIVQLRRPARRRGEGARDLGPRARWAGDDKLAANKLAYVETYGCRMNVADSDMVLGMLARAGYGPRRIPPAPT